MVMPQEHNKKMNAVTILSIRTTLFQGFSLETTAKDAVQMGRAMAALPPGTPVNIAFLGSESFEQRLAAVQALIAGRVSPRPIISSRRITSHSVLQSFLEQAMASAPLTGIFLVGGDPQVPQGPFSDSLELIGSGLLDGLDVPMVGVPGYPEGHPHIRDEVLWDYLTRKIAALRERGFDVEITTQLSFDSQAVVTWIEKVRQAGLNVPIRVGIPSPSSLTGILRFAKQCRVGTSAQLLQRYGWHVTSLLGTEGPERFLTELMQVLEQRNLGEVRLHLYPLGDVPKAVEWLQTFERQALG